MAKSLPTGYMIIPVELCAYALTHRLVRPLQLLVYLKENYGGKVLERDVVFADMAFVLEVTPKTIKANLNKLRELNWLGYNPKSGYYFIRGFEAIRRIQMLVSRTGVEFIPSKDLLHFRPFSAAAVIGFHVNNQRWRMKKRGLARYRERANQGPRSFNTYHPIADEYLAKVLNISLSTAHRLKHLAKDAGYIDVANAFSDTYISSKYIDQFRKTIPHHHAKRLVIRDKHIVFQKPDLVKALLRFKRRKKLNT